MKKLKIKHWVLLVVAVLLGLSILYNKFILPDQPSKSLDDFSEKTSFTEINKPGIINTVVDGFDMGKANIWASNTNKDRMVTSCSKGEEVTVLLSDGTYYKIKTKDGKEGWLMHGFVQLK